MKRKRAVLLARSPPTRVPSVVLSATTRVDPTRSWVQLEFRFATGRCPRFVRVCSIGSTYRCHLVDGSTFHPDLPRLELSPLPAGVWFRLRTVILILIRGATNQSIVEDVDDPAAARDTEAGLHCTLVLSV